MNGETFLVACCLVCAALMLTALGGANYAQYGWRGVVGLTVLIACVLAGVVAMVAIVAGAK